MKPHVLLTRRIPASAMARLEAACDVDTYIGDTAIPRGELLQRVRGKQALICLLTEAIDQQVVDAGADLKIVANIAVGYNNIDVPVVRRRGVIVTNTPDVLTEATADFAWALILAITRRVAEGDRLVRRGEWKGWALDFMLGTDLRGKQLGIVGFGRIGRAVAARAAAFGLNVACTDILPDGSYNMSLPGAMQLDRLLSTSDVVSLHVPLTDGTRHLIDQKALARMKRSAYLVNTSRGPVVDEAALAWALRERVICGAALDVYEREPEVHSDLLKLENVILAPHLASATVETRTAMADLAVRNVIAVLNGEPAITPVP